MLQDYRGKPYKPGVWTIVTQWKHWEGRIVFHKREDVAKYIRQPFFPAREAVDAFVISPKGKRFEIPQPSFCDPQRLTAYMDKLKGTKYDTKKSL